MRRPVVLLALVAAVAVLGAASVGQGDTTVQAQARSQRVVMFESFMRGA